MDLHESSVQGASLNRRTAMTRGRTKAQRLLARLAFLLFPLAAGAAGCFGASANNLAFSAMGARAHSWEPGVTVVPEHEPSKVNDGSLHTYWAVRAEDLPGDIGVEW